MKISVLCITYNHEEYISQALESMINQKTNLTYNIVIGEDHSTDNTRQICQSFKNKYSDKILLLKRKNNLGMVDNFIDTLMNCDGEYIAICEGDDYWTDSYKLQKQVDYLDANEDCSLCFHANEIKNMTNGVKSQQIPHKIPSNNKFILNDIINKGGNFITSNSIMFRSKYIKNLPRWFYQAPVGDVPLLLILASKGTIGYLNETMSVYRFNSENSFGKTRRNNINVNKDITSRLLTMWNDFNDWSGYKYNWQVAIRKLRLYYLHYSLNVKISFRNRLTANRNHDCSEKN